MARSSRTPARAHTLAIDALILRFSRTAVIDDASSLQPSAVTTDALSVMVAPPSEIAATNAERSELPPICTSRMPSRTCDASAARYEASPRLMAMSQV